MSDFDDAVDGSDLAPEEPWESDISEILAGLPDVEPPDGFISVAIDHRPLFAGRVLVGLAGAVVVVFSASFVVGVFGQRLIVPPVGALAAQHAVTRAGLFDTGGEEADTWFEVVDDDVAGDPVRTSDSLDLRATLIAEEDLRQAVYRRSGDSVSIFSQPGRVKFDDLPDGDRVMIDGVLAWVDVSRQVVVLETAASAVTIIGLTPQEVAEVVEDIPRRSSTAGFTDLVNSFTKEIGFPELD